MKQFVTIYDVIIRLLLSLNTPLEYDWIRRRLKHLLTRVFDNKMLRTHLFLFELLFPVICDSKGFLYGVLLNFREAFGISYHPFRLERHIYLMNDSKF